MKKTGIVFLALLLLLAAYAVEGGMIKSLLVVTALVPIIIGPYLSTLFTYSPADINNAFCDAFTDRIDAGRQDVYHIDLLIIRNLNSAVVWWAATLSMLALVLILSTLTDVKSLGPSVAAGTVAILAAFLLRSILFIPMEHSILRKLAVLQENNHY